MEQDFSDIAHIIKTERANQAPCYASLAESIFGEADRLERKDINASVEDRERIMREAIDNFYAETENN